MAATMRSISSCLVGIVGLALFALSGCGQGTTGSGQLGPAPTSGSSQGLDGAWKLATAEQGGQAIPQEAVAGVLALVEFSGNKVACKVGDQVVADGTVKFDAGKQPRPIDLTLTVKRGGQAGRSVSHTGVYAITSDTLRLCLVAGGGQRPTALQTQPGSPATLLTYRRVR